MHSAIDPSPSLRKASPPARHPILCRQDFSRFYDQYAPLVYGHLLRQTSNSALADSLLAEVFGTLWVERTTFNAHQARTSQPHPISWLLNIAHRDGRLTQASAVNRAGVGSQPASAKPASDTGTTDWLRIESAHR